MKFLLSFVTSLCAITSSLSLNTDVVMCVADYRYNYNSTENVDMCGIFHGDMINVCEKYITEHETVSNVRDCFDINLRGGVDVHVEQFINFMVHKFKVYNTIENFVNRFYIYKDNMKYIETENAKGHSYTLGDNFMADLTNAEYVDTYLTKDYTFPRDYCEDEKLDTNFPLSVDWVSKGAVTSVKDQGQCGSCWAFSTVGALEGANAINTGNLVAYSEQELVSCAGSYGNHGCNGGLMQRAFSYVMDKGMTLEQDYPYTSGTTTKDGTCESYDIALTIDSCYNVGTNEEQLTSALSLQPVSVSIEADQRSFQLYTSGVYDDASCGTTLDHGVLAVGYGHKDGKDYYRVKNSWSETWGDGGYIYLARNSVSSSKDGMCGIAMDASYPGLQ